VAAVTNIVELPLRETASRSRPRLSESTMLISLFLSNGSLHPFIKELYRRHGIVTVGDWRASSRNLLAEGNLDPVSLKIFADKIGAPTRPRLTKTPQVVPFPEAMNPTHATRCYSPEPH
jgi:hypothetical protein